MKKKATSQAAHAEIDGMVCGLCKKDSEEDTDDDIKLSVSRAEIAETSNTQTAHNILHDETLEREKSCSTKHLKKLRKSGPKQWITTSIANASGSRTYANPTNAGLTRGHGRRQQESEQGGLPNQNLQQIANFKEIKQLQSDIQKKANSGISHLDTLIALYVTSEAFSLPLIELPTLVHEWLDKLLDKAREEYWKLYDKKHLPGNLHKALLLSLKVEDVRLSIKPYAQPYVAINTKPFLIRNIS
ncbi:hypothetical protein M422DRAFT_257490 [Sphaerobolus stellatus SS14]|uniref:Uncharacterized protein n=1 Tax=Sphaerobolus stellatus (strain SS14) TaxID=990650 RepID=A0A0C9VP85_SPHS4|nr:hypothetical protein M422DRAFT_257490 [Sphaerobolus stellatus SS14]